MRVRGLRLIVLLLVLLSWPGVLLAATVTTFLESGTDATQDLSFFVSTTGTMASATDQSKTGPRSLKGSSGAGNALFHAETPTGVVVDSGTQLSAYFRFDTLTAINTAIYRIRQSGGLAIASVQFNTDGTLSIVPLGATTVKGTTVLLVNTWYRISWSYYITNTTTFQFKIYINGVLEVTANVGTLTRTTSSGAAFGSQSLPGANVNFWFDDIYIATGGASSSSQPDTGDIRVTSKRPNANGTTNGFTTQIGAGGSGYGSGHSPQENEQPLSQTNGWSMIGAGSAVTEEYNVEGVATGDVDITGQPLVDVGGWVFAKSLAGETASLILKGATANISLTSTPTLFSGFAGSTVYPAGTGTDIGIITDTSLTTVSLYECGILIAYTPSGATSGGLTLHGAGTP